MEIITENYQLVYQSCGKCEIYRDTGVSKKGSTIGSTRLSDLGLEAFFAALRHFLKAFITKL